MRNKGKRKDTIFWSGVTSSRRMRFKILGMSRENPPLVAHPDPPIKNTLGSVLGLITVITLKRV